MKKLVLAALSLLLVVSTAQAAEVIPTDPLTFHPDGEFSYALEEAFSAMGITPPFGKYPLVQKKGIKVVDIERGPTPNIPPVGITPLETASAQVDPKAAMGAVLTGGGGSAAPSVRQALKSALDQVRRNLDR